MFDAASHVDCGSYFITSSLFHVLAHVSLTVENDSKFYI